MEIFDSCLEKLKEKCKNISINEKTIMNILKYAMEIVEITELKGDEQKNMSIKIIKKLLEDSDINEESKEKCIELIESSIFDSVIDLIVQASKGNVKINIKKRIKKLCCM